MYLLVKFGGHNLMEMDISVVISTLALKPQKKLNSLPGSIILGNFKNQLYQFTIPKP